MTISKPPILKALNAAYRETQRHTVTINQEPDELEINSFRSVVHSEESLLSNEKPEPSPAALQAVYRQEAFWRGAAQTRSEMMVEDDSTTQYEIHHQGAARVDKILRHVRSKLDPSWLPAFKAWKATPEAWVKK